MRFLTAFIAATFFSSPYASEIISAKPDFIKMRHSADVTVNVSGFEKGLHLSLIPGGAFVKKSKSVNDISAIYNNFLISAEDKSSLVIYQANKSKWQEVGFIELKQEINKIFLSGKHIYALTNKEIIEIDYSQAMLPEIISRKPQSDAVIDYSSSKTHSCTLTSNNLTFANEDILSTKHSNQFSQTLAFDQFCISLSPTNGIQVWAGVNGDLKSISQYKSNSLSREIILINDVIAIADGTTGVSLLRISSDGRINWLGSYNKLGNIIHIAYDEQHLIAADDKGVLSMLDISNPSAPLLISDFHTHESISAVQMHKKQSYILSNNKISNIDFNSNSSPLISTLGVNQGGSRRSFIENDILYVADWFSGLHLYDIRNSSAPRLLSSFHTPGSPKGVVVRNGVAFVADDDHGLQIIDVSKPRSPVFISEIPLSGLAYTMKLIDDLLYIASHRGGFHIVNVSDPIKPVLVSTYDTPSKAWALEYKEGLLYVADDSTGLMIFDVKNPAQPKLINQFNPRGFAEDVILIGNKAYIAFFDLGLFIVDITDPLNLKQLAHLKTPGNARGIEIRNNLLYLASWEAGVQIIDISSDTNPHIVGHYDTKGAVWGLSVKEKIIYAMDWWGGVKIIDASQTEQPVLISQYQTAGIINDLKYYNRFIYTAQDSRGVQVYDASNDLNPVWATGVDISGNARTISINKELAVVAAGDGGIAVIDISNPFHSKLLGQLSLGVDISLIKSRNNLIFAAEKNGDLFIIDIENPRLPKLLKRISSSTEQLIINDEKLFVLNNNQTLSIYSVKKMAEFDVKNQYNLPIVSHGLHFVSDSNFILRTKRTFASCEFGQNRIKCNNEITLPTDLIASHIVDKQLYATTTNNDLYVFAIQADVSLKLNTIYPTSHRITGISTSKGGIFFAGESIIASGKLLPKLNIQTKGSQFSIQVPNNMPKGAYHLALTHKDGSQSIKKNAVIIGFPKLKSKFTLEQLKAIMKQKNFDGKAPVAP